MHEDSDVSMAKIASDLGVNRGSIKYQGAEIRYRPAEPDVLKKQTPSVTAFLKPIFSKLIHQA
ncbi:hypothetical protein CCYS_14125 [Corynebacterium cystitidis DSM 20524]|uniref:Uncharacterized protein n=1 Tax=Corynebacterium cystitidis DSM 20524 TaxID=1121357 RepID=A0A1H9UUJ5_9CORY|nr:hypothetical protein CCYS_14125 [Corynebacterium cystitidis DSM 20524]SES13086.1 hypothetical protein SAMN05661109_01934 [Corynebacterium cystitidis DSM 20524]SNV91226.1 Uncharacterised protein [Corynebacterium cystitidis]